MRHPNEYERRFRRERDGGEEHRGERHGRGRGGPHAHGSHAGHGSRGRGYAGRGGWQQADLPDATDAAAWLAGRLPDEWFVGQPTVTVDREEIVVIGELAAPESDPSESGADESDPSESGADESGADGVTGGDVPVGPPTAAAAQGRIGRFREQTRAARMTIADEAEARYGRKLAWGATIGDTREMFTQLAVPVMTRLRHDERRVLDTLVDSGVARSRSDALNWCVRLVGDHTEDWLSGLREAMSAVDTLRAQGPRL